MLRKIENPIEPTPTLEGKDAQDLLREIKEYRRTPEKEAELKECAQLFEEKHPDF